MTEQKLKRNEQERKKESQSPGFILVAYCKAAVTPVC